jgi:hypothetical protein
MFAVPLPCRVPMLAPQDGPSADDDYDSKH